MKTSCGIILSDGESILAGLATGKKDAHHMYDLAGKGGKDKNESYLEAAIRELREETGIDLPITVFSHIKDLGQFKYIKDKELHLFSLHIEKMPEISTLFCDSTYEMYGRQLPEIAQYKNFGLDELFWFYKSLEPVLKKATSGDWLNDEVISLSSFLIKKKKQGLFI